LGGAFLQVAVPSQKELNRNECLVPLARLQNGRRCDF
jgi:hypothetical protein